MSIPEGWKLVPITPTEAMLDALCGMPWIVDSTTKVVDNKVVTTRTEHRDQRYVVDGWGAMLDAAPEPPSGTWSDRGVEVAQGSLYDILKARGMADVPFAPRDGHAIDTNRPAQAWVLTSTNYWKNPQGTQHIISVATTQDAAKADCDARYDTREDYRATKWDGLQRKVNFDGALMVFEVRPVKAVSSHATGQSDDARDAARYRWWCKWWLDERDDCERVNSMEYGDDKASYDAAIDAEIAKDRGDCHAQGSVE